MQILFAEYEKDPFQKGIANFKIKIVCEKCQSEFFPVVKSFRKRSENNIELCNRCYLRKRCYDNPDWKEKNSKAQLISQNLPEQKMKNALGVSKSWTKTRRQKNSDLMKKKWAEVFSEEQKQKLLTNISWTQKNDDRFERIMSKSCKMNSGYYNGIFYNSLLELCFLLVCEERDLQVGRYDLEPVAYIDENGKSRKYYPDFILKNKVVVEIKGHIFNKNGGKKRFQIKKDAAKSRFNGSQYKYKTFLRSPFLKVRMKMARRIHEDNKQKN